MTARAALGYVDGPAYPSPDVLRECLAKYFGSVMAGDAPTPSSQSDRARPGTGQPLVRLVVETMLAAAKARQVTAEHALNRAALERQVAEPIAHDEPVAAHMLWSPKKHWVVGPESSVDVAELAALNTLQTVQLAVAQVYPPGMRFQLDVEDLEFEFMEGEAPPIAEARARYLAGVQRLIRVLRLERVFVVRRVSDKAVTADDLRRWRARMQENYEALARYWWESEHPGVERNGELASYRALQRLGWTGPIPPEMRRHYLDRLGNLSGVDDRERVAMVLRNLAGVLLHRQENLGRGGASAASVKFSFIPPAAGAPPGLLAGRVDLRFVPRRVCSRVGMAGPWSTKGHVRWEAGALRPAFLGWHEIEARGLDFLPGHVVLRGNGERAEIRADLRLT